MTEVLLIFLGYTIGVIVSGYHIARMRHDHEIELKHRAGEARHWERMFNLERLRKDSIRDEDAADWWKQS